MRRWRQVVGRWLRRMKLRPPPLDYETPGNVGADPPPGPVEIVVPVHGAHAAAAECLAAVARYTDLARHRLRVVVDGDPGFTDADARRPFAAADDVEILRHDRLGYVASCNRAMALSRRDVVLLNSDTRVTAGWLDKLRDAAYSHPAVATATPWSNNATICSLPRPLEVNDLPPGHDDASFARLVEAAAERRYPRLPTGVGMCLYVKRRALERVGTFDEAAFGEGYGEETDFCFRALKAGFVHVLDDATFVFHHGQQSFGGRRAARVRAAERRIARRHPEYVATIAEFLRRDPLAGPRRRILRALEGRRAASRPAGPARVLHVVHGWPPHNLAGTELYAHWLARWQSRRREVAVYARVADPGRSLGEATEIDDGGVRVRLVVNNFRARNPLVRNALRSRVLETDFDRFAAAARPELIHVHHLAGHALSLMERVAARGVPVLYQIQDWWAYCARANLMQPDRGLCSGPAPGKCAVCLPLTRRPPAALWNRLLYRYRGALAARALARADAYVMGSQYIERCYREQGLLRPDDRVWVLPYGVPVPPHPVQRRAPSLPLRFGFIGSLLPHKGAHVAVAAFHGMDPRRAVLDVWGDPEISPAYARELAAGAGEAVRFHGRFAESEKREIFARLDVLLVPSLGLESFGLVAREAIAHGAAVIASRRGALAELFDESGHGGAFVAPGDADGLRRLVDALADRPETVAEWIRAAPPVVGTEEHAAAIEEVYAQLGRAAAT